LAKGQQHNSDQIASRHFWTALEQGVPDLLAVAASPAVLGVERKWSTTDWGKVVKKSGYDAFELACPRVTPRQVRAYTVGIAGLRRRKLK
jgi:hypothetical protein